QNPGGGFGAGCATWGVRTTCFGSGSPDNMFRLVGNIVATLYSQYDNTTGSGPPSQDFQTGLNTLDAQAADDLVVPAGQDWNITQVNFTGSYSGSGPAASFHIFFYQDNGSGLPGTLIYSALAQPYTTPDSINFVVTLATPAVLTGGGTYWLSVQARQDFTPNGQFFWNQRTVQSNSQSAWQNPGGGFGSPCTAWTHTTSCGVGNGSPDLVFSVFGFIIVTNASPVATDDGFSTNEDIQLNVSAPGVLGNDTDVDGNSLSAVLNST